MEFELIIGVHRANIVCSGYGSDMIIESIEDIDGEDMVLSPSEHEYVYRQAMEQAMERATELYDWPFSER